MRTSVKRALIAASAAAVMGAGISVTAHATPSCNGTCVQVFSEKFGPGYITDSFKQQKTIGNPVILFQASNSDPAEDFVYAFQGTVGDLYNAGLVSSQVNLHYSSDSAYEFEYAPFGVGTDLCIGTATTPANGTAVTLQPCGRNGGTAWILDQADANGAGYLPLINGLDTNFSHPYVLSYPGNSFPTDKPRPQLHTWQLRTYSTGDVYDTEMWSFK